MRNKEELINILDKKGENLVERRHAAKAKEIQTYLYDKYDMPTGITIDYICKRCDLNGISESHLFAYADGISHIFPNDLKISDYFVEREIRKYSSIKLSDSTIKLPIKIKCVQISDNQWIGYADIEFFIMLRKHSLINYNTNAQRVLQKAMKNGNEYYKISLNKKAIEEIKDSYKQNAYIPNTITLNIPTETEYDYSYDEGCLSIKNIEHFDISDGYHRYIAMTQLYDEDNSFNYPMELRITNFDDSVVKQFIFQEDQKTQMKKIDSDSMNMKKDSNIVCETLNNNMMFDLKGQINRTGGLIDLGQLSEVVDKVYFKDKHNDVKYRNMVVRELKDNFNCLIQLDDRFLEERYTFERLISVVMSFKYLKDKSEILKEILYYENYIRDNGIAKKKILTYKDVELIKHRMIK